MSFSNAGTHDTGDTGSWYKPDQYNYKYNGYSGHNDNNNYSDKPHKNGITTEVSQATWL